MSAPRTVQQEFNPNRHVQIDCNAQPDRNVIAWFAIPIKWRRASTIPWIMITHST